MTQTAAQTEDFLNGGITVVLDLLKPPLDICKRFNSTDVVDDNNSVCASVESTAKHTRTKFWR